MDPKRLTKLLRETKEYFDRSTRALEEKDSGFAPNPGIFTAAQQVAHVAQTVDWFLEGAFGKGFDMNFEGHLKQVENVRSLKEARAWLDRSFAKAIDTIGSKSAAELSAPMQAGPVMGGEPRAEIVPGIVDHTAHHRGALSIYARQLGKVPPMPYMEMD